ncbi:MAG: outer membrane protein transport protein [Pseudomonadota bacterium]
MTRQFLCAGTALTVLSAGSAFAGGLERAITNFGPLYEDGSYLEISGALAFPELDGDGGTIPPGFPGAGTPVSGNTGDLLESVALIGAAYKADINDRLSFALILNQPFGADTLYPSASAAFPDATAVYGGSNADVVSYALNGILAYDVTPQVKIYGGPIIQAITPQASVAFLSSYNVESDTNYGVGYTLGASYSIPDIAFRAALTYRSEIEHDLDTTETIAGTPAETQTVFETPDSLTLDLQSGIAEDTLLFGQVHWADWSEFAISPPNYITLTGGRPLVAYAEDWTTYTLGVGRRFDENWSGAISVTYEPQTDTELTSLGPVDGRTAINLGATYETDKMKISGGISYTWLGDAQNVLATDFDDGTAVGIGFRIGWKL